MNFYDENALVGQQLHEIAANSSSFTIENNEETEVNDNFNESSVEGIETTATEVATKELTEDLGELNLNADSVHEFNEESQNKNVEDFSSNEDEHEDEDEDEDAVDNGDSESDSDDDDNEFTATSSITKRQQQKHSNYVTKKEREDLSSSDDDEEAIEMSAEFNSEWANLAEDLANANDKNNDLSNDIDEYAPVPVDLSNDIAVNDIAAAQVGYPLNPDAEFIDVNGVLANHSMPKFEKLTIAITPTHNQEGTETEDMK
ncbi:serine/threonine-protein kinase rio2-like [Teleopsis dalmanni]|uniref:serine/threonine-protein kinase rio2-like n=1 Tax=Teleopsis dalmanni TaxID=139649 RepID=UPI0018CCC65F|nr:serine/threonine-protein kinase rio2-like [Teleopsis dalmanni]